MLTITQAQIDTWLALFWWPYLRLLGLMLTDPFYSSRSIPARVRIGLSIFLVLLIAPNLQPLPAVPLSSASGFLIVARELAIGLAMGFVVRIMFSCMEMAGHLAGLQMGLGFATFYDPQHSTNVPIIAQFFSVFTLLVYLSFNGHLIMLQALFDSYAQLPIQTGLPGAQGFRMVAEFGSIIFRAGVMISLPVLGALLITNLAIGVMTRAAPQLNVFAVGFPITLGIGFAALYMMLPYLVPHLESLITTVAHFIGQLMSGFSR